MQSNNKKVCYIQGGLKMSEAKMLPLGSVVILKGNVKKMMIIARLIALPVKGQVYRFDYGACLYPEGMVGDSLIYFN